MPARPPSDPPPPQRPAAGSPRPAAAGGGARDLTGHLRGPAPQPGGHLSAPPPAEHRAAHPPSPKAQRELAEAQRQKLAQRGGSGTAPMPPEPRSDRLAAGPDGRQGERSDPRTRMLLNPTAPRTALGSATQPAPTRSGGPLSRMGTPEAMLPTRPPAAPRAADEAEPSRNYLRRHWRGDLPLAVALIASGALVWLAVQALDFAQHRLTLTEQPLAASGLWLLEVALLVVGALWWGVGVARAAIQHGNDGGSAIVALLAFFTGIGAFVWVGLFWWQSARHVAPDVWAIVTGTLQPAAVVVDGAEARLEGDLEFGSMRVLRAALDAHPEVRRVRLASRGGRVGEGLALGRLIAARNLDTLVSGECSSACVTAFAGGRGRYITPAARLGLHSAGGPGASTQGVAAANQASDRFIADRGVDLRVLEKGAAVANESIWFPEAYVLLASGLATDYAAKAGLR